MGYFCASHPIIVLTLGLALCIVFSCGFFFFSVLTDPVQLWSPENSVTRQNKDYYDSHFRPFYRTTQLIIRATNQTPWYYTLPFYHDDPTQYSSIFQKEFLSEVLTLQNKISSLTGVCETCSNGTNVTVTLKDICFAPLLPDNDNCTIQSILNYWQNNQNTLDYIAYDEFNMSSADWITHFSNCVSAPTTVNDTAYMSCLGEFGGTVMVSKFTFNYFFWN